MSQPFAAAQHEPDIMDIDIDMDIDIPPMEVEEEGDLEVHVFPPRSKYHRTYTCLRKVKLKRVTSKASVQTVHSYRPSTMKIL